MTQRKRFLAYLLALAMPFVVLACGESLLPPEITRASVTPNPVPEPGTGQPTNFKLQISIEAADDSSFQLFGHPADDPQAWQQLLPVTSCRGCTGELIEIACTSARVPADDSLRELTCEHPVEALALRRAVVKAGHHTWRVRALTGGHGSKDITALIPDDETRDLEVELR